MQKYKDFSPTPFDETGLNAGDQGDWLVAPCSTHRDAVTSTRANWEALTKELDAIDPEGNDHQINSYGHWACGWFEIILVRPGSECERACNEAEEYLSECGTLSEEDYQRVKQEDFEASWDMWLGRNAQASLIKAIEDAAPLFADDFDDDPDKYIDAEELDGLLVQACNYEMHNDGPSVNYYDFTEVFKRLGLPTDVPVIFVA